MGERPATSNGTTTEGAELGQRIQRTTRLLTALSAAALVAACSGGGGGGTTPTPTTPAAPTASAATSVGTSVFTATWGPVGNANTYQVDVLTSNAFASFLTGYQGRDVGNVTTLQVTALMPNTPYYYRVYARNSAGQSGASPTIAVTTLLAESCSGSLASSGQVTCTFSITNDGHQVIATLTSLSGASSIGVLVGTSSGGTCTPMVTNDGATVGTNVIGPVMAVGTGCVRVYAPGNVPANVTFTVSVQHW